MTNRATRSALPAALLTMAAMLLAAPADAATFFKSPTGNIGCGVSRQGARCDIREHSWRPPPKPRSCKQDWGYGLTVGERRPGRFFCAGDSVLGLGFRLSYGKSIRRGRFKCISRMSGMRCVNVLNKHGFQISRERALRF